MSQEIVEELNKPQSFKEYQEEIKELKLIEESVDSTFLKDIRSIIVKRKKVLEALKDA